MKEYIEREAALSAVDCSNLHKGIVDALQENIKDIPAADVVDVDDVAKMLTWLFADHCPCNYNDIDEWLPYVCELSNECPSPKDKLGCWKQFIKHHKAKMDGGVNDGKCKGGDGDG